MIKKWYYYYSESKKQIQEIGSGSEDELFKLCLATKYQRVRQRQVRVQNIRSTVKIYERFK